MLNPIGAAQVVKTVIDRLTLASYIANREQAPAITVERWARIYPNAAALEVQYQERVAELVS